MRTLRHTLYVSLTLQICLAAAIMAAAEESSLSLVTIPLALGSLVVIDMLGWLSPPRLLLNLAGLVALGFALEEFRVQDPAGSRLNQLSAGGHLLVYLTWTLLLQAKDLRRMWWMFALSILQVALGAVQTNDPWFGVGLFVYTASTVWTMALLSLTRAVLLIDPHLLSPRPFIANTEPVEETPSTRRSSSRNGVRTDEQGRWISPRFLGGGVLTFLLTLCVGMAFFVFTPRIWIGSLNVFGDNPLRNRQGATGFTENVRLGDIGQVMESNELVMEVGVYEGWTGLPVPPAQLAAAVGEEPLFRGAVLETYDQGSWEKGQQRHWWRSIEDVGPVRLQITMQPIESAVLFFTGSRTGAQAITEPKEILYQPFSQSLERSDDADPDQPYAYIVWTKPPGVDPDPEARAWHKNDTRMNGLAPRLLPLLETPTSRLSALARQLLNQSAKAKGTDSEATARVLEEYLRDSGEFSYTLDLSVDDPTIDPVEDFAFNRKRGHCEYFASTLALMLRGVGIPSRLISGFKGAEYNPKTRQLEVRALHAHAWVEAFVDGGWVTLDPTPETRDFEVAAKAKDQTPDLVDKTRSFWFQGMSYSQSQQDQLVYGPMRKFLDIVKGNLTGMMQGEFPLLGQLRTLLTSVRRWFSGEGGIMAIGTLLVLASLLIWLTRSCLRRWRGWSLERELAKRKATTVAFFDRLLSLLQRFGLPDIQTLTPREFANRAEDRFESRFRTAGITGLTLELVEVFYAVRFGEQPLSLDQLGTVEHQLSQLERSLAQPVA